MRGRAGDGVDAADDADAESADAPGRRRLLSAAVPRVPPSGSVRDTFVEGTPLRAELGAAEVDGVVLVLGATRRSASTIMQASRPFTRRLAHELGGAKRHFALNFAAAAAAVLAPLAALSAASGASGQLDPCRRFPRRRCWLVHDACRWRRRHEARAIRASV